jgi:hypothetical protein
MLSKLGVATAAGVLILATPAHADVRILDSDVSQIKKDAILPDNAKLIVPAGHAVTVYLPATHETKVIVGPYEGRPVDYNRRSEGTGTYPQEGRSREFGGTRQPNE